MESERKSLDEKSRLVGGKVVKVRKEERDFRRERRVCIFFSIGGGIFNLDGIE